MMQINLEYLKINYDRIKLTAPIFRTAEGNYNLFLIEDKNGLLREINATLKQEEYNELSTFFKRKNKSKKEES